MPVEVKIPELGESISEVVLTTWHKSEGDWVDRDESLFEIESDKITTDVPAPESGVVSLSVEAGSELSVGAVVASIDPNAKRPAAVHAGADAASAEKRAETPGGRSVKDADNGHARATSVAKRIADEKGIDLNRVEGSGPGGRITKEDVLRAGDSPQPPRGAPGLPSRGDGSGVRLEARPTARGTSVEKMSRLRQRIADRLVYAKNSTAMLTTFNECDMSAVMAMRKKYKEPFIEKHGVGLGFMSFFVKACCSALREFPRVNAYIVEDSIEYHDFVDLSVAVSTDKGLTVPILRDVHAMSFAEIEAGIKDLAERARDGKLTMDDLTGGTFTITNGGVFGSLQSTPILNPPQSGILGMHAIQNRPVEDPDKPGQIALRPMMYLALSYDHRIVDGKEAVSFLVHIKQCIEDPARLMLEV